MRHKPLKIIFPSSEPKGCQGNGPKKSKKSKKETEADHEDIADLLGIDRDVQQCLQGEEVEMDDEIREIVNNEMIKEDDDAPSDILKFRRYEQTHPVPFALIVDFESFIVKGENDSDTHEPSGFSCLRVSVFDFLNKEQAYTYSGPDVMSTFYDHVSREHELINRILSERQPMTHLTEEQQREYDDATICGTCEEEFTDKNHKVRHHCHVTGNFIAATCNSCNLKLKPKKKFKKSMKKMKGKKFREEVHDIVYDKPPKDEYEAATREIEKHQNELVKMEIEEHEFFLPIVCHNMRNYDGHLIIKHLEKHFISGEIKVIANNSEKFMAFQIGQLRFLDSFQFMNASLDALTNNLKKDGAKKFVHTRRHFKDDNQFAQVTRKGVLSL